MSIRPHGTPARYSHGPDQHDRAGRGCRCTPCRQAVAAAGRHRYREMAYGRWQPYTDAGPAREHVRRLQATGIGWEKIADLAQVPSATVSTLLYGRGGRPPTTRIRAGTATALLAVRPTLDTLPGTTLTDATGTRRRLQAMTATGWSLARLAARLGIERSHLGRLTSGKTSRVTVATALTVRALYGELWCQPPPMRDRWEKVAAARTRNHAETSGWVTPGWWDDDPGPYCIDDPAARPAPGWKRQETVA